MTSNIYVGEGNNFTEFIYFPKEMINNKNENNIRLAITQGTYNLLNVQAVNEQNEENKNIRGEVIKELLVRANQAASIQAGQFQYANIKYDYSDNVKEYWYNYLSE